MRTCTCHLTLAALASLAVPAAAPEYEASDYLPLAVGNSWTFLHEVYDLYHGVFPGGHAGETGEVTIRVERTTAFGDTTYYVLSDLPPGWAPPPPHCPVGKTLRWKGSELMERTDTGERSFFRFEGDNPYTIPWTHGDDEVRRQGVGGHASAPVPVMHFLFEGHDAFGDWLAEFEPGLEGIPERTVTFLAGYGFSGCIEGLMGPDYEVYTNGLACLQATLVETSGSGATGQRGTTTRTISYWDALDGPPSATAPSTWGQVKGSSP